MNAPQAWPSLSRQAWLPSGETLHMWTQIAGKVKLALCPWLNELWEVALSVNSRGITTGNVPLPDGVFEIQFDFIDHEAVIRTSGGESRTLALRARPVADFFHDFMAAIDSLSIRLPHFKPIPDEVADPIPFADDRVHASYDADLVQRWWRILLNISNVFEAHRSTFVGKSSPVQFWWGGFDLSQTRFSGRPAPPPASAGRIMRLAEDQESIAAGFWSGSDAIDDFAFYSYAYPEPAGYKTATARPRQALYQPDLGEFILRYEAVRSAADPAAAIAEFLDSTYEIGANLAGWDRDRLERPAPRLFSSS